MNQAIETTSRIKEAQWELRVYITPIIVHTNCNKNTNLTETIIAYGESLT